MDWRLIVPFAINNFMISFSEGCCVRRWALLARVLVNHLIYQVFGDFLDILTDRLQGTAAINS